jgi:hypothetical protein
VYVRIRRDWFGLRHVEQKASLELVSPTPFSMTRMLVGQFTVAEKLLRDGVRRISPRFWSAPKILMHPLDMAEEGLSEVEHRVMMELAAGAGASWVDVWVGKELSDHEVAEKLRNRMG